MKLDEFLPQFDVRSQHSIEVQATPAEVYAALTAASLSQIPIVRVLTRLRGFSRQTSNTTMRESLRHGGFIELCDLPSEEIAYGIIGQFWLPSGGRKPIHSTEEFAKFSQAGFAKAAWNFRMIATSSQRTQLCTETRVRLYGQGAAWKFRAYWLIVAPFSGLLRGGILRDVKRRAEQLHRPAVAAI
jgi:hypothetical protein